MTDEYTYEFVFGSKREGPEDGAYRARLASVFPKKNSKDGTTFLIWTFQVADADITVSGSSSTASGPDSKAYQWATSLLGRPPKEGEGVPALLGMPATVVVAKDQKGYAKVTSVNPWPEGRTDAQIIPDEPLTF